MIRGGQGRSARQVEESAVALAWCIGIGLALLSVLVWVQS